MTATITPVPGREYQISGSAVFEHDGQTMNGVLIDADNIAWAGHLTRDTAGEYLALAFDADDSRIEAHPDWASMIVRETPGIGQAAPTV